MLTDIWNWLGTSEADAFNAGIFLVLSFVFYAEWRDNKADGPLLFIICLGLFLINFVEMVSR